MVCDMEIRLFLHLVSQSQVHVLIFCVLSVCPMSLPGAQKGICGQRQGLH